MPAFDQSDARARQLACLTVTSHLLQTEGASWTLNSAASEAADGISWAAPVQVAMRRAPPQPKAVSSTPKHTTIGSEATALKCINLLWTLKLS